MEDIREARRKIIIDRAKEILHKWTIESMPSVDEVYKEISETMKVGKVEKYGPEDLPAGPGLDSAKEIIVVEGRADIINLMRCGIFNTVALEGAKVPESIKKLTKERSATALLDGDRGGDLILKELQQVTNVKFVGRAPRGKEIEECNCKEIAEAIDRETRRCRSRRSSTFQAPSASSMTSSLAWIRVFGSSCLVAVGLF